MSVNGVTTLKRAGDSLDNPTKRVRKTFTSFSLEQKKAIARAIAHATPEILRKQLDGFEGDINAKLNINWVDLFFFGSSEQNKLAVIEILISVGADINILSEGWPGLVPAGTPLTLAIRSGSIHSAQALINTGADVNKEDAMTLTPLHLAVSSRSGGRKIGKALVDAGASVYKPDFLGETALHSAHKYVSELPDLYYLLSALKPDEIEKIKNDDRLKHIYQGYETVLQGARLEWETAARAFNFYGSLEESIKQQCTMPSDVRNKVFLPYFIGGDTSFPLVNRTVEHMSQEVAEKMYKEGIEKSNKMGIR